MENWRVLQNLSIAVSSSVNFINLSRFASDFKLLIDTFIYELLGSTVQFQLKIAKILLGEYQTGYSTYFNAEFRLKLFLT